LWPSLMIISSFCLLQCAGGSWLTTVRQNSNVIVEIFEVFHQTLFFVGTHCRHHPWCKWSTMLQVSCHSLQDIKSQQLVKQKSLTAVTLQQFVNIFWSKCSPHVFQVQDRDQKPYNSGSTACQCCSQLLLWPSQFCWQLGDCSMW
jgi:hypothetical protein